MNDSQFAAHRWLSRMWDVDEEIRSLEERASNILGANISKYEVKEPPSKADPNPTESKNIEYSMLKAEIDKKNQELAYENVRTYEVISKVAEPKYRGMLYSRYVLRKSWKMIGKEYNYERSQAFEYRKIVLDAVAPYIPREVLDDEE